MTIYGREIKQLLPSLLGSPLPFLLLLLLRRLFFFFFLIQEKRNSFVKIK